MKNEIIAEAWENLDKYFQLRGVKLELDIRKAILSELNFVFDETKSCLQGDMSKI